jgi:hypothetical protein
MPVSRLETEPGRQDRPRAICRHGQSELNVASSLTQGKGPRQCGGCHATQTGNRFDFGHGLSGISASLVADVGPELPRHHQRPGPVQSEEKTDQGYSLFVGPRLRITRRACQGLPCLFPTGQPGLSRLQWV